MRGTSEKAPFSGSLPRGTTFACSTTAIRFTKVRGPRSSCRWDLCDSVGPPSIGTSSRATDFATFKFAARLLAGNIPIQSSPREPTAVRWKTASSSLPPYGRIGRWMARGFHSTQAAVHISIRHRTLADDLSAHSKAQVDGMRIAITGSSGLIGNALIPFLTTGGHSVTRVVRRDRATGPTVRWDPVLGTIDQDGLEGHDAIVHLAGENIAGGRWNARRKRAIRDSRLEGTRLLCDALNRLQKPPKTLVCASAIGFYGDRGDEVLDERFAAGEGFLADLCKEWEAITEIGAAAGHSRRQRAFRHRTLRRRAGRSPTMLTPFKLGVGGVIGSGRQYMSWIGIDDVVGAIHHAITCEALNGPVNVVAPNPVTNRDFTKTLGRVLRRPTMLPMPAFAARSRSRGDGGRIALGQHPSRAAAARRNRLQVSRRPTRTRVATRLAADRQRRLIQDADRQRSIDRARLVQPNVELVSSSRVAG